MKYHHIYITNKEVYKSLNEYTYMLQTGGKEHNQNTKCDIDDSDTVIFGSGGSSAIIVITKDNRVYKIFTLYVNKNDLQKKHLIKKRIKMLIMKLKYMRKSQKILSKNIYHRISYNILELMNVMMPNNYLKSVQNLTMNI